jgi:hypothetical protein
MTRQTSDVLMDIEVIAEQAKNALGVVDQSKETEQLSVGVRSIIWICVDYLHKISVMAQEAQKEPLDGQLTE